MAQSATSGAGPTTSFEVGRVRRQFPLLEKTGIHYLDSAATSQMPDVVLEALRKFNTEYRANVHGGVHRLSRTAISEYERARGCVSNFINARSQREVVFTSGTTSAINIVAHGFGETLSAGDEVVLSILEHHSNLVPWQMLARRRGVVLRFVPRTEDGRLDYTRLDEVVTKNCRLIAVTHCSNVTGAITDVAPIVQAARSVGARILLDGAQRVSHGPVDVRELDIDFYAFSGHKMFGPTGIGVLWGKYELLEQMPPLMTGGQMIDRVSLEYASFTDPPRKFEAGTPPIGGAIGMGAAVEWMHGLDWLAVAAHEKRLAGRIIGGLLNIPGARLIGSENLDQRRGVVSFVIDSVAPDDICRTLDVHNVALRCGHHCAQPLLASFDVGATARASVAAYNDDTDVDAFLEGLERLF